MPKSQVLSMGEAEKLDGFCREGGLRQMASPRVHYHEPSCPHADCRQQMEWIDFQLELFGDPEGICKSVVRSWWEGTGFVGRCPSCGGWVRFTTMQMEAIADDHVELYAKLPDSWHTVAQFA